MRHSDESRNPEGKERHAKLNGESTRLTPMDSRLSENDGNDAKLSIRGVKSGRHPGFKG